MNDKIKPVRVQRKRTKGFSLQGASPNGLAVVYVGRPGKYGNPFTPGYSTATGKIIPIEKCLEWYELSVRGKLRKDANFLEPLRGKNLACFCRLQNPCHGDVLLRLLAETNK